MRGIAWDYKRQINGLELQGYEIDVEFRRYGYDEPANLSGNPDNWTPAEGEDEVELIEMTVRRDDVVVAKTEDEVEQLWTDMWELIEAEIKDDKMEDYHDDGY